MPAQSQQQQKLFGLALAFKRGEVPSSEVSDEIKAIADRMSEKEIEDFASTKHKGLPKMKEQLRKIVREIMRERAISEIELSKAEMDKLHSDGEVEVDGEKVTYDKSVNEGKKSKDSTGIRKVVAISNNADAIIELVFDDKKDPKEVIGVLGPVLVNAINATLKHKFKPTDGNEDKLNEFKSKLKELLKLVEALIKKPSKAGTKRLETMHRDWWNHSFGADIVFNGKYQDSIIESVNEAASRTAMEIGGLTGMNKDAIQKFVDSNELDIEKVFQFVKKGKLKDRMDLVSAIAGKPNNPIQKKMIKMFKESVNEDTKKRFDVDFYNNDKSRTTSHEEIIRGDKFSDVVSQAIKIAKSKGMVYVEFYYKDAFIGSIDKRNGYEFKKGRSYQKSPLSVTEGASNEEKKIVMMAIKKIAKYRNVPLNVAVVDTIRAAEELERTIKK